MRVIFVRIGFRSSRTVCVCAWVGGGRGNGSTRDSYLIDVSWLLEHHHQQNQALSLQAFINLLVAHRSLHQRQDVVHALNAKVSTIAAVM